MTCVLVLRFHNDVTKLAVWSKFKRTKTTNQTSFPAWPGILLLGDVFIMMGFLFSREWRAKEWFVLSLGSLVIFSLQFYKCIYVFSIASIEGLTTVAIRVQWWCCASLFFWKAFINFYSDGLVNMPVFMLSQELKRIPQAVGNDGCYWRSNNDLVDINGYTLWDIIHEAV